MTVTVKVKVKVVDLGDEERMLPIILLKEGERLTTFVLWVSTFLIFLLSLV